MARVNQGYYKNIINQYKELINEIDYICVDDISEIEGDYEDYFFRLGDLNDVYVRVKSLMTEIGNLLRSQKFEDEATEIKYENYELELSRKSSEIEYNYTIIKNALGFEFSDAENNTLSLHVLR